ncbi:DUF3558 domain-containing protein [Antrihabitans spumae]|uniref:DUF3558 domain-containing protein n=1 Tax=Antrihabitans spumae TaxID=3373370 RepID=A0ABW7K8W8_9NOCA
MTVTTRAVAALVAVVWLSSAAGCGSTTEGKPVEATGTSTTDPDEPAGLFDPCTEISDDLLRQMGVDPATESSGISGVEFEDWKICHWIAPWYALTIYSSSRTIDEIRTNSTVTAFREVRVAQREALEYHTKSDRPPDDCFVGIAVPGGIVEIQIMAKYLEPKLEEPCVVAERDVEILDDILPN